MVTALKQLTIYLAGAIEVAAAIIIGFAAIEATLRAFPLFVPRAAPLHDDVEIIRLRLGRWLTLAIEFELAADILSTAVTPTWNDIGQWQPSLFFGQCSTTFFSGKWARLNHGGSPKTAI